MPTDTVSIICPVGGAARYLSRTIASVQAQTHESWELLLIDDRCAVDLMPLAAIDDRIRLITSNRPGATAARNAGLARLTGTFVAFLDSDDLWRPEKLETQCAYLEANPDWGAVYSQFDLIDEFGERLGEGWAPSSLTFEGLCRGEGFIPGSNIMVRASLARKLGPMSDRFRIGDDIAYLFCIAKNARFGFIPEVLLDYRRHTDNMTSGYLEAFRDLARILREQQGFRGTRSVAEAEHDRKVGVRRVREVFSGQALDAWRCSSHRWTLSALRHLLVSFRISPLHPVRTLARGPGAGLRRPATR